MAILDNLSLPHVRQRVDSHKLSRKTQKTLQLAYELARRNFDDRTEINETEPN